VPSFCIQNLKEIGVTSTSARSDYVAIGPDGRKLTSSTGTDAWKHKDSKAKTHYSFNELTGAVESRVYNSEVVLNSVALLPPSVSPPSCVFLP
jgi:hypothetical protein